MYPKISGKIDSKFNPLREKLLTIRQLAADLDTNIDDLIEKTANFLNKPNNIPEFEKNLNEKESFQTSNSNILKVSLLEEEYKNLNEKILILESDYNNFKDKFIPTIRNIATKKWKFNIKLKEATKYLSEKDSHQFKEVTEVEQNNLFLEKQTSNSISINKDDEIANLRKEFEEAKQIMLVEKSKLNLQLQEANDSVSNKNAEILKLREELAQVQKLRANENSILIFSLQTANNTINEKNAEILKLREELGQREFNKNSLSLQLQSAYNILNNKDDEILDLEQIFSPLKQQKTSHNNLSPLLNLASSSHPEVTLTDIDYDMFMQLTDSSNNSQSGTTLPSVIVDDLDFEIE